MKILGPQDTGKGILVEMDAGYISPTETHNKNLLEQANKNMLTFGSYLKTVSNHPSPYFKVSALRAVIHLLRPSQSIGPLGCF